MFSPPDAARPKKQLDDTDLDVRRWVPDKFCQHYADAGVTQLYRWQVEALGTGSVLGGESLVYTAPTSGGKTMVAEILMLRSLLTKKRKAIMVLPYVSIVSEKCKVRPHCLASPRLASANVSLVIWDRPHTPDAPRSPGSAACSGSRAYWSRTASA